MTIKEARDLAARLSLHLQQSNSIPVAYHFSYGGYILIVALREETVCLSTAADVHLFALIKTGRPLDAPR